MHSLHPIIFLLVLGFPSYQASSDLTYEELEELDANCHMLDSCNARRSSDSLQKYTCQCGSYCAKQNTCCIDSRYRDTKPEGQSPTCRPINEDQENHYFMVDQCPSSNRDTALEKLCKEDWNNEDNLLPLLPVTSVSSNLTYKNTFCLKCNEATDDFLYWKIKLNSDVASEDNSGQNIVPVFDKTRQTWTAPIGKDGSFHPVVISFEIPDKIQKIVQMCVTNAISSCSEQWRIRDVKEKCGKYTSYIFIVKNGTNISYKNPHCALCNFESLGKMGCGVMTIQQVTGKKPFSFTRLLDINPIYGDKVDTIERCDSKSIWDPFFEKCRPYACAFPGYVVKDGKCTPP